MRNSPSSELQQHVKCCQPGKLVRDTVPRVFTVVWSHRHLLLVMSPNSRLPEGEQEFSINHRVCLSSLGTVRSPYQVLNGKNPPEVQVPRLQPRANLASRPLS